MADPIQTRKHLEDVTAVTLLGIRFWDPVQDSQVREGLTVTARPESASGPEVSAFRTGSGIYAFQGLPGMRDWERGAVDLMASPLDTRRFLISVRDQRQRFLPALFGVTLPLPYRGVYPAALSSPPDAEDALPGFYLFSAPTRTISPGLAAVRARLVDKASQQAAAFAVLEIDVNGESWSGIADEQGQVAVMFPYPAMDISLQTSPPGMSQTPLQQQQWDLALRVAYEPSALDYPNGADLPHLSSILHQSPGVLWPTQGGIPVSQWLYSLTFGQELILRTDALSELWIESGSSPP